jgi:hypothetical protein
VRRLLQRVGLRADLADVVALERLLQLHDPTLDRRGVGLVERVAVLLERALRLVRELLGVVLRVRDLLEAARLVGVRLCVADHLLNLVSFRPEPPSIRICCWLPVPRSRAETLMIPFRVDVERDLDLRHAPRRRRDADELELAERLVERRPSPTRPADVHLDGRLVVLRGRERLGLLRRDRRVALDQPREDAALRLDAERQRRDVEQEDVLDLALEHTALDRGADGDDLVRVDALVGLLADQVLDLLDDRGHARHAADEHDVVDLRLVDAGVLEALLRRPTVRASRSAVSSLSFARVSCRSRCFGPSCVAVMNGRLICVVIVDDSSIFAFSAASYRRCSAIRSAARSMPWSLLNSATIQSTIALSKLSPPRWLSPFVAFTSKTPSPSSRIDTSNVPPPRSKTRIVWSEPSLSRPYASAARSAR